MPLRLILTVALLSVLFPIHAYGQLPQPLIADARRVDWSNVGVQGGIPARSTVCATLNPGASSAEINTAILKCPAGQVVKLNPGVYNLSAGINFGTKSDVTLRGSGADQTFLIFSGRDVCRGIYASVCLSGGDTNYKGAPSNLANWTSGFARGSNILTLSHTTRLAVGHPLTLDQLDDTADGGQIYACSSGPCVTEGDGGGPRPGRTQQQIVTVTAINGTQVSIAPGLYMPNWRSSQSPQAWWPDTPLRMAGVEDLSADHTNSGGAAGFAIFNCNGCWVKGVRSIKAGRSHVFVQQSSRVTVRDSYFYENKSHTSSSYGVETIPSSDTLIENNIFQAVTAPVVLTGSCAGCVIAYNYSVNNLYTASANWQSHSDFLHAGGTDFVLFESNYGVGIYSDTFHGTHHFVTAFRNRYNGFMANGGHETSSNTIPLRLDAFSRYFNIIGNVLGDPLRPHKVYESGGNQSVYQLGVSNGVAAGDDSLVARTLLRWGNFDTVSGASRFEASEIPTGLIRFANPVPQGMELPPSLYLAGRPNFFPASTPWPAIGPDVVGGNVPNVAGHAFTIPAQDCYRKSGGAEDGTGGVLSFNAAACYPSAPVGTSTAPAQPTHLRIVSGGETP